MTKDGHKWPMIIEITMVMFIVMVILAFVGYARVSLGSGL